MKWYASGSAAAVALALAVTGCSSTGAVSKARTTLPQIDMAQWQYNADDDVYWQVGISYAAQPADSAYETLGLFVPGAYFAATQNGDGTYTCAPNAGGTVAGYSAKNAPFVIPVETPGYSACNPPSGYTSSVKSYTDAGFIYVYAGCRGRDHGAPAGVTDLKAAIRYVRYNAGLLPGNTKRFFSFGMSGGGAQSALLGATGNAPEYEPYLEAIGAVMGVSDALMGSMCWCPITNLDQANEAYEWNMGITRTFTGDDERALSDGLTQAFAQYINGVGLRSEAGTTLTLSQSDDGIFQAGTYYDYIKATVERSLNNFLSDTEFPYDASSAQQGGRGGFGGPGGGMQGAGGPGGGRGMGGTPPANGGVDFTQIDNIQRTQASGGLSLTGTYQTPAQYVAALNSDEEWVYYDEATNTATIKSVAAFAKALKSASKSVGAFDDLNATQGENTLFGYADGKGAHFDPVMADILQQSGSPYAAAYAADLAKTDALGTAVADRLSMYTPLYYLNKTYGGYKSASVAPNWRIRTGISQGDTALCTEVNLALALKNYGIKNVDFETVWGQKHVEAERTGSSTQNFIAWVNSCL